jgi:hypothetical protein
MGTLRSIATEAADVSAAGPALSDVSDTLRAFNERSTVPSPALGPVRVTVYGPLPDPAIELTLQPADVPDMEKSEEARPVTGSSKVSR